MGLLEDSKKHYDNYIDEKNKKREARYKKEMEKINFEFKRFLKNLLKEQFSEEMLTITNYRPYYTINDGNDSLVLAGKSCYDNTKEICRASEFNGRNIFCDRYYNWTTVENIRDIGRIYTECLKFIPSRNERQI